MTRPILVALLVGCCGYACEGDGNLAEVRPVLALTPAGGTLTFEDVVLGQTTASPEVIQVQNRGSTALVVSTEVDQPFIVSSFPEVLAPNKAGEIFVRYQPLRPGASEGYMEVESNDPMHPFIRYGLRGFARESCVLLLEPAHQHFRLNETRRVLISALRSASCKIMAVGTDRSLFELDLPPLPFVIEAGQTIGLEVTNIAVANDPGRTIRDLWVRDGDGNSTSVSLEGEPPIGGCLSVDPPRRLTFPTTPIGMAARKPVTVRNACARAADIKSAVIGSGYQFFSVESTLPQQIPAHGSSTIDVVYQPFAEFGDLGLLHINTNDVLNPRFTLKLFGEASKPKVQTFPEVVDFGSVSYRSTPQGRSACGSRTQMVQLYSVGDAQVEISSLEISPNLDTFFQITGVKVNDAAIPDWSNPIVVPPNREGRITLQFFPSRESPSLHESELLIHHNAEGSPTRVLLRGAGRPDETTMDQFIQPDGPKLDVLWVVANTPFNAGEHMKMRDQVADFVRDAEEANADYQMAVTVTDSRSTNAGKLERCQPHPAIIRSEYADRTTRIEALECLMDVGVGGAWFYVSGLGAAMRAVERAIDVANQDPSSNPSAGLLRSDAKLVVIVVSSQDDHSVESNALLRDYFLALKRHRTDAIAIHALAGPVLGPCESQPVEFWWPGYRYFWMTRQMGGVFGDVCQEDWRPFFRSLAFGAFEMREEWSLSAAADPRTLLVTVNGIMVTRDASNGYSYQQPSNSVRFHGNAIPERGASVSIQYSGLCRP